MKFTATFTQIRSWPVVDGWHVDPSTGLHALVGTRIGQDYPITAGNNFRVGDDFCADSNFHAGDGFSARSSVKLGNNFHVGNLYTTLAV